MTEVYEFTKIHALTEDPNGQLVSFSTDAGKRCSLVDQGAGQLDVRLVRRAAAEGLVVFVAYEQATGRCNFIAHFNRDYVGSVEFVQHPQPSLEVRLVLRPSILYLLPTHPRFAELRGLLEKAKREDQEIWVGTFPGDRIILDARLPKP